MFMDIEQTKLDKFMEETTEEPLNFQTCGTALRFVTEYTIFRFITMCNAAGVTPTLTACNMHLMQTVQDVEQRSLILKYAKSWLKSKRRRAHFRKEWGITVGTINKPRATLSKEDIAQKAPRGKQMEPGRRHGFRT